MLYTAKERGRRHDNVSFHRSASVKATGAVKGRINMCLLLLFFIRNRFWITTAPLLILIPVVFPFLLLDEYLSTFLYPKYLLYLNRHPYYYC